MLVTANSTFVQVNCDLTTDRAFGGGSYNAGLTPLLVVSRPFCSGVGCGASSTNPNGWQCVFSTATNSNTCYVLCTP